MLRLSFIAGLIFLVVSVMAQSPHGKDFKLECSRCHSVDNWDVQMKNINFNHDSTGFKLLGQHKNVECRLCHPTLLFSQAKKECADCHTDVHQNTTGHDCERCHNNQSFVVSNITQIHMDSRFPLFGAHKTADCVRCHPSESNLQFKPLGVECVECHNDKYLATTNPNHQTAGFSTECSQCHDVTAFEWKGTGFTHDFFPLTSGHASLYCSDCHGDGYQRKLSTDCYSCHAADYNNASEPDHKASGFSTACAECHTTNPGWKPASYKQHDSEYFPIYSGKHKGVWSSCTECHPTTTKTFTCIDCHHHNKTDTDSRHRNVGGYSYNSNSCYSCHPSGSRGN